MYYERQRVKRTRISQGERPALATTRRVLPILSSIDMPILSRLNVGRWSYASPSLFHCSLGETTESSDGKCQGGEGDQRVSALPPAASSSRPSPVTSATFFACREAGYQAEKTANLDFTHTVGFAQASRYENRRSQIFQSCHTRFQFVPAAGSVSFGSLLVGLVSKPAKAHVKHRRPLPGSPRQFRGKKHSTVNRRVHCGVKDWRAELYSMSPLRLIGRFPSWVEL